MCLNFKFAPHPSILLISAVFFLLHVAFKALAVFSCTEEFELSDPITFETLPVSRKLFPL